MSVAARKVYVQLKCMSTGNDYPEFEGQGDGVYPVPLADQVCIGAFVVPSTRAFAEWLAQELTRLEMSAARFDLVLDLDRGLTADIIRGSLSPDLNQIAVIVENLRIIEREAAA